MKPQKEIRFVWLDVETTGLDPNLDLLLEVAWKVTLSPHPLDFAAPLGEYQPGQDSYVIRHDGADLGSKLSPVTWKMHGSSGLLAEVVQSPTTVDDVERCLLGALDDKFQWHLAGNSVHFDLGFIRAHMIHAAKRLSHRVLDVSSIGLAAYSMGMPHDRREPAHRALDDVKASISQYRQQLEWISRRNWQGGEPPARTSAYDHNIFVAPSPRAG